MSDKNIREIGLFMAMEGEASPLIQQLSLAPVQTGLPPRIPLVVYQGEIAVELQGNLRLVLVLAGKDSVHGVDNVATQPATLASFYLCNHFKPDLLLNAGTAGGLQAAGASIGDVYVGYPHIMFHDRRIPIPGFDAYGLGKYPALDVSRMTGDLVLKTGVVSTGNSLDATQRDLEIIAAHGAVVKDMEAAAVAWVGSLFGVPVIVLKAITDLIDCDRPTADEFVANFEGAGRNLRKKVIHVLHYCCGKSVGELGAAP